MKEVRNGWFQELRRGNQRRFYIDPPGRYRRGILGNICMSDYLRMAFPPNLPSVEHVVINSSADEQPSLRTGISATVIPDIIDFEHPPSPSDGYASDVRQALGIKDEGLFILQLTRVAARKGIEHAIERDGYVTQSTVEEIRKVLSDPGHCGEMVEHNYRVACTHYSFSVLQRTLHYYLQQHCEVKAVCGCEGSATKAHSFQIR